MTARVLATAAAAASLAGVAVLGMTGPALAQEYPPATGVTITDATPVPGQTVTVSTGAGAFDAGTDVVVTVDAFDTRKVVEAAANGSASTSFEVPAGARPGRVQVHFSGTLEGAATSEVLSFTVVSAAAAGPGRGQGDRGRSAPLTGAQDAAGSDALPFTGADALVPLAITGVSLVGAGAGIVLVARRRRETTVPSHFA